MEPPSIDDQCIALVRDTVVAGDIDVLEAALLAVPGQAECPIVHRFGPGLYIREMHVPAGAIVVGHEHLTRHVNMLLAGRCWIVATDGRVTELVAPHFFVGDPGRKAAYFPVDSVWQNIHATEETDLAALEALLIRKSAAFLAHEARAALPEPVFDEVDVWHG